MDTLVNNLWPLADGKTQVPMKEKMKDVALEVISKVNSKENALLFTIYPCTVAYGPELPLFIVQVGFSLKMEDYSLENSVQEHTKLHGIQLLHYLVNTSFSGLQKQFMTPFPFHVS